MTFQRACSGPCAGLKLEVTFYLSHSKNVLIEYRIELHLDVRPSLKIATSKTKIEEIVHAEIMLDSNANTIIYRPTAYRPTGLQA